MTDSVPAPVRYAAQSHGVNGYWSWINSWSHTTDSVPVKSEIEDRRLTDREVVVFTVAVDVVKGKRSGVPFSWMMAAEAATEPDMPAVRMVMRARRCQLLPVDDFVCVQIVVEPSLS